MHVWLRHFCLCFVAIVGSLADARAAFLPPELETVTSSPERSSDQRRETPPPERLEVAALATASMAGTGAPLITLSGGAQLLCPLAVAAVEPYAVSSRLQPARERVCTSQGFLLDILRPPRV
ncbi:MAG: hypothetical protein M3552_02490 [Planctomycetota bacterium]|nr:hypothetical protein [Planctomycetaceae bacterium]MDQ3329515.1 hypothetical protein [Planctomycetota bacterium]